MNINKKTIADINTQLTDVTCQIAELNNFKHKIEDGVVAHYVIYNNQVLNNLHSILCDLTDIVERIEEKLPE
jgi:hypothetical protein